MKNSSSSSSNTASFRWLKYKKLPGLEAKPTAFFDKRISSFEAEPSLLKSIATGIYQEPKINKCCDAVDTMVSRFQLFSRLFGPASILLQYQIGFIIGLSVIIGIGWINRKLTPAKRFLIGGLGLVCYLVRQWFEFRKELLEGEGGKKIDGGGPAGGLAV